MPCHVTWKEAFYDVLNESRRKANKLIGNKKESKFLVATSTREIMAEFELREATSLNKPNGVNVPNTQAGKIGNNFIN